MKSVIEVSIYEITDINKSIKNKEFEGVNEEISKKRRLLTRNSNNFISLKILKASSLTSK